MILLRKLLFYGYTFMLLGVGASGIFVAAWELTRVFGIPLAGLDPRVRATMLNQYRFLKSAELSFGLFSLFFRERIFDEAAVRTLFVTMVFLGVGARVFSVVVDGAPHWAFLAFAALEFVTGIAMLTGWPAPKSPASPTAGQSL